MGAGPGRYKGKSREITGQGRYDGKTQKNGIYVRDPPNIILIIFDTMRLDVLDSIKSKVSLSNLQKLQDESVIFYKAISSASWTIPSHASLFTGTYPSRNSVIESLSTVPDYDYLMNSYSGLTLAEYFKRSGFETISISQNSFIGPNTGLARGFDQLLKANNEIDTLQSMINKDLQTIYSNWGSDFKEVIKNSFKKKEVPQFLKKYYEVKRTTHILRQADFSKKGGMDAVKLLDGIAMKSPFFLFFNFMEMHDPHDKVSLGLGWPDTVFGNIRTIKQSTYDGYYKSVFEVDRIMGSLIKALKDKNLYENTAIILTSDHGQALFEEKGYFGHGNYLYDSIVKVPLWVKMPFGQKFIVNKGYQSLTSIFNFLINLTEYEVKSDIITSESAFSESFGFIDPIVLKYKDKENFRTVMDKENGVRRAIFRDDCKLTYNFTSGKIEEFKKTGRMVDPKNFKEDTRTLIDELSIFSNTNLVL